MSDAVSPYYEALGDRLRSLRLRGRESLLDVQDRSAGRWQAGTLRAWECGERRPQAETVTELAAWYDVSPSWLLTGESDVADIVLPAGSAA
jgi:transcriptional regulator with XRE-family HTH domain